MIELIQACNYFGLQKGGGFFFFGVNIDLGNFWTNEKSDGPIVKNLNADGTVDCVQVKTVVKRRFWIKWSTTSHEVTVPCP